MDTEELLEILVEQWEQLRQAGQPVNLEDLCRDHPELLAELRSRVELLERMQALRESSESDTASRTTLEHPEKPTVVVPVTPPKSPTGYEILGQLGRGGMGVVYKARHLALNRLVALKMILAGEHAGAVDRTRLRLEAAALARLKHPHIVQVYEIGDHNGTPFLSLEYVEGGNLSALLREQPLPPRQAAELVRLLALAMQTAHEAGILHRDLKPSNILLAGGRTTQPRIADFGLAKQYDLSQGQTSSGGMLGTPAYMAPEQLKGGKSSPAMDVYALGVLLYECLTGQVPFRAPTVFELLDLIEHADPVAPTQLNARIPADLTTICLKCLNKEPGQRYESAGALAEDLQRYLDGEPVQARPVSRLERTIRWARRHRALAALYVVSSVAALAMIGVGLWVSASRGEARAARELAEMRAVQAELEAKLHRERAEQTEKLLLSEQFFTLTMKARETIAQSLPGWSWSALEDLSQAAQLPDARMHRADLRSLAIACLDRTDVRAVTPAESTPRPRSLAWHPSGKILAVGERAGGFLVRCQIHLLDLSARKRTVLSFPQSAAFTDEGKPGPDIVNALCYSNDGRYLAAGMRSGRLHVWDLRETNPQPRTRAAHPETIEQVTFSRDDQSIYTLSRSLIKRWETAGLADKRAWICRRTARQFAVHPKENWLVLRQGDETVRLDGTTLEPILPNLPISGSAYQFTPDGEAIVFANHLSIQVRSVRGDRMLQTLRAPDAEMAHPHSISALCLSPDGTILVSSSEDTHSVRLWNLVGGRLIGELSVGGGLAKAAFAPDGRRFAVLANKTTEIFELANRTEMQIIGRRPGVITSFTLGTGSELAVLSETGAEGQGELLYWHTPFSDSRIHHRVPYAPFHLASSPPLALAGNWLAYVSESPNRVHACKLGEPVQHRAIPLPGVGRSLQFGPDKRLWGTNNQELRGWSVPWLKPVAQWNNSLGILLRGVSALRSVAVGREWVVVAGQDGIVRVFRAGDGELKVHTTHPLGERSLVAVALSPDEKLALVGGEDGRRWLLRIPNASIVTELPSEKEAIGSVSWAVNDLVATGSHNGRVRVYLREGENLTELFTMRLRRSLRQLQFTHEGGRLALLLEGERGVRVWHLGALRERLQSLHLDSPELSRMSITAKR